MGFINPATKDRAKIDAAYKKQLKRLKTIHNFSFDARQKLTPQRKAAITKAHNKYNKLLHDVERGKYTIIKGTKQQIKNLSKQFPVSNKVAIYNKPTELGTVRRTKIIGRGKNTNIVDDIEVKNASEEILGRKFTFYIQFPSDFKYKNLSSTIDKINDQFKPDYISTAIKGYAGTMAHDPKGYGKYAEEKAKQLPKVKKDKDPIISGVYLIYFRKRLNNKWLLGIERKIESLF